MKAGDPNRGCGLAVSGLFCELTLHLHDRRVVVGWHRKPHQLRPTFDGPKDIEVRQFLVPALDESEICLYVWRIHGEVCLVVLVEELDLAVIIQVAMSFYCITRPPATLSAMPVTLSAFAR